MQWVLAKARSLGLRSVILEVAVDNFEAQHFYAAFGFHCRETIPGYYNGITDAFQMELALPADGPASAEFL